MKKRTTVIAALALAAVLIGVPRGLAYVQQTIATYDGICVSLTGFAGLLQDTGLLRRGTCKVVANHPKVCLHRLSRCTVKTSPSGPPKTGRCRQSKTGCFCVVP